MNKPFSTWKPYFPFLLIATFFLFLLFELSAFIDAFLGSVILYVLLRPLMRYLIEVKKWKRGLAALVLMIASFMIILVPVLGFCYLFVSKLTLIFSDSSFIVQAFNSLDQKFKALTGNELLSQDNLASFQTRAAGYITGFFSASLSILADIGIMYLMLYYMLINTGALENKLNEELPFSAHNIDLLSNELKAQTISNAIGMPLLALIQGIFAWLGYWIFGLSDPFFWGMMTGFFSFLPLIGTALIWLPAAVYQSTVGTTWQGVGIFLYGLLVIGTVDNVFRFVFQKQFANVHPLITVFGVIIGLQMFGIPGLIFGPLILSWFIILIRIYRKDFFLVEPVKKKK